MICTVCLAAYLHTAKIRCFSTSCFTRAALLACSVQCTLALFSQCHDANPRPCAASSSRAVQGVVMAGYLKPFSQISCVEYLLVPVTAIHLYACVGWMLLRYTLHLLLLSEFCQIETLLLKKLVDQDNRWQSCAHICFHKLYSLPHQSTWINHITNSPTLCKTFLASPLLTHMLK